eukprot:1792824-Rhodomonas_salina.3
MQRHDSIISTMITMIGRLRHRETESLRGGARGPGRCQTSPSSTPRRGASNCCRTYKQARAVRCVQTNHTVGGAKEAARVQCPRPSKVSAAVGTEQRGSLQIKRRESLDEGCSGDGVRAADVDALLQERVSQHHRLRTSDFRISAQVRAKAFRSAQQSNAELKGTRIKWR